MVRKGVEETAGLFIAGAGPKQALGKMQSLRKSGLAFTIDLLGEYCVAQAVCYLERYLEALNVLGNGFKDDSSPIIEGHAAEASPICISVKLSALYSQCSPLNFAKSGLCHLKSS